MGRRIPIENADSSKNDDNERQEEPMGQESSMQPTPQKVRKAYLADEADLPIETPAEEPAEEAEEEEDLEERLLRLAAEFDNYKKRMEREQSVSRAYANESLLESLLPVVDNLERALAAAEPGSSQEGLVAGVELTLKELLDVLRREGVEPIDAEGQSFDPTIHEAVLTQPSTEVPEGGVVSQIEKGYRYKERILRPAKVIVSSGSP